MPLAWIMGVPSGEVLHVSNWMGQKTILNEFVAYFNMATFLKENPGLFKRKIYNHSFLCFMRIFQSSFNSHTNWRYRRHSPGQKT